MLSHFRESFVSEVKSGGREGRKEGKKGGEPEKQPKVVFNAHSVSAGCRVGGGGVGVGGGGGGGGGRVGSLLRRGEEGGLSVFRMRTKYSLRAE